MTFNRLKQIFSFETLLDDLRMSSTSRLGQGGSKRLLICRNPASVPDTGKVDDFDLDLTLQKARQWKLPGKMPSLSASPFRVPDRFVKVMGDSESEKTEKDEKIDDPDEFSSIFGTSSFKRPTAPPIRRKVKVIPRTPLVEKVKETESNNSFTQSPSKSPRKKKAKIEVKHKSKVRKDGDVEAEKKAEKKAEPEKKVTRIFNWVPRMKKSKIMVEGDVLDPKARGHQFYPERWSSSRIIARKSAKILQTRKGEYILEGCLHSGHARSREMPYFIVKSFKSGFPADWEEQRDRWAAEVKEEFNSFNTTTQTDAGEVSAFVPAKRSTRKKQEPAKEIINDKKPLVKKEVKKKVTPKVKVPDPLIVANPKTIKERKKNKEVIRMFNSNHSDNFFQDKNRVVAQVGDELEVVTATAANNRRADDIANDLFMSDSENDVSIHSARTPIGNYFNRTKSVEDILGGEEDEEVTEKEPNIGYIHKKLREKQSRKARKSIAFNSPNIPKQSILKKSKDASKVPDRIVQLMKETERDEDDEDEEKEYDSCDEDSIAASSVLNPPSSLLEEYNRSRR